MKKKTKKNIETAPTLSDFSKMDGEQKNAFAERLLEQLMKAEESVKKERKPEDVIVMDLKDTSTYTTSLKLYDEAEYVVREYLVHEDVSAQFGAQIDGLVRLDEIYKIDLLSASGDIEEKDIMAAIKDILYTPGNVQGKAQKYIKKDAEYVVVESEVK